MEINKNLLFRARVQSLIVLHPNFASFGLKFVEWNLLTFIKFKQFHNVFVWKSQKLWTVNAPQFHYTKHTEIQHERYSPYSRKNSRQMTVSLFESK